MALWRLSWREFGRRPLRALLTLFSIVIGVAAVLAVSLAIDNARFAQKSMLQTVVGQTDIEIYQVGNGAFHQNLIATLRAVPGVKVATPIVKFYSSMFVGGERRIAVQVLGVEPLLDQDVREYRIVEGNTFTDDDQMLLDQSFAQSFGLNLGSKINFTTSTGPRSAVIVGLTEPKSGAAVVQGGVVVVPVTTGQKWNRLRSRISSAQVIADERANRAELLAAIEKVLPEGVKARVPLLRSDVGQEATVALDHGLGMASAFSFMIGIFIIYNTFQMNVGERRRQLGILRALGTTRKQIIGMIVGEGLLLGIFGTLIGWGLGLIATQSLTQATANMMEVPIASYSLSSIFPFVLSGFCGIAVAVVGAYFPAARASRLSPAEAMRVVAVGDLEPSTGFLLLLGILLSPIGFTILVLCVLGKIHIDYAITGSILFLLGYILMIPSFIAKVSIFIYHLFQKWFNVEGKLARLQLLRHRIRSSLTIAILFIAISTGLGMACTILDNIDNVRNWATSVVVGDFFIRSSNIGMANEQAAELPTDLLNELKSVPGVKEIDITRYVEAQVNGVSVRLVARDFSRRERKSFHLAEGEADAVFEGLAGGEAVIGSVLAERGKIKIGDDLQLQAVQGTVPLRVVGIVNDYMAAGLTVYLDRKRAEALLNIEGANLAIVDVMPGELKSVETELRKICESQGLLLQSQTEVLKSIRLKVDGIVAGLWAVLALCSVIAAFGLINTLTMNILEQTPEIGMLRAVAMTRGQVRKMILSQAVFMGLIGLIPGVLAGILIAYLLALSVLPTTGHAIEFEFRPWLIFGSLAAELVIVLLASLIPAERAARIPVSKAMQF